MDNPQLLPKKSLALGGIFFTLALLAGTLFIGRTGFFQLFGITKINPAALYLSRLVFWSCLGLVWLYARFIEKQKLLIREEKKYSFLLYCASVIAVLAGLTIALGFVGETLKKLGYDENSARFDEMLKLFRGNYFLIFFTSVTAGFVEELLFRGYLLSRMELVFKSPVIAIFLSSILFGLMHFGYGTVYQLVGPFIIGLGFAFYYWQFRNIKVVIFCHCIWDIAAVCAKLWMVKH